MASSNLVWTSDDLTFNSSLNTIQEPECEECFKTAGYKTLMKSAQDFVGFVCINKHRKGLPASMGFGLTLGTQQAGVYDAVYSTQATYQGTDTTTNTARTNIGSITAGQLANSIQRLQQQHTKQALKNSRR